MSVDIQISGVPWVQPESMSVGSQDVWFQYNLYNSGDEDGSSSGFTYVLQDPSGSTQTGECPADTVQAGASVQQGARIDAATFSTAGTYWITLYDPSGNSLGGASVQVSE